MKTEKIPKLRFLSLEISQVCDQQCTHCYVGYQRMNKKKEIDFNQWSLLIKNAKRAGCEEIRLTGGEPTISEFFFPIIKEAHEQGLRIGFNTHGFLSADVLEKIVKYAPDKIFVSFEGAEKNDEKIRSQGHFKKAMHSAVFLKEHGLAVVMNVHIRKNNIRDIDELGKIAIDNKLVLKLPFIRPIGRANQNLMNEILGPQDAILVVEKVEKLKRKYPELVVTTDYQVLGKMAPHMLNHCPAGIDSIHVGPSGNFYPCGFLRAPEFILGNTKEVPIDDVWNKAELLRKLRNNPKPEKCRKCKFFTTKCSGAARCAAYYLNGNLFAEDPICFVQSEDDLEKIEKLNEKIKSCRPAVQLLAKKIFETEKYETLQGGNIIRIKNIVEGTEIFYNTASRQPRAFDQKDKDKMAEIKRKCESNKDCVICKKNKNNWLVTNVIPGAYTPHHEVLFFNDHNPLNITVTLVNVCILKAIEWSIKEEKKVGRKGYPYIFWNTLIGSEIHGHAHLMLAIDKHFGDYDEYLGRAKKFKTKNYLDYFDALFKIHNELGLAVKEGNIKYFMNLVPKSSREVFAFAYSDMNKDDINSLSAVIAKVCQNWISREYPNAPAISIFISYQIPNKHQCAKKLLLARIVDRRYPLIGKTDRGTVEEFAFKVVSHDPFWEWQKLEVT